MGDAKPEERWLPVAGWEGRYEVSDHGRVRSVDRPPGGDPRRPKRGRVLKPRPAGRAGYGEVSLSGRVPRYVHTLVAEAFIGPRPSGMECCHNNGDHRDNRALNLRWDTHGNNQLDKSRHGTDWARNKTHCPRRHLLVEPNLVAYKLRTGHRLCLACDRAARRINRQRRRGVHIGTLQEVGDAYYAEIMRGMTDYAA